MQAAKQSLENAGLPQILMVDCSHANSKKEPARQKEIIDSILQQKSSGDNALRALMLESHLLPGRQDAPKERLEYGKSITDACLGLDETVQLLNRIANAT